MTSQPYVVAGFTPQETRRMTWLDIDGGEAISALPEPEQVAYVGLLEPAALPEAINVPDVDVDELLASLVEAADRDDAEGVDVTVWRMASRDQPPQTVAVFGRQDELLTLQQVAGLFGCSVRTVRRRLNDPDDPLVGIYTTPGTLCVLASSLSAHLEAAIDDAVKKKAAQHRRPPTPSAGVRVIPLPRSRKKNT